MRTAPLTARGFTVRKVTLRVVFADDNYLVRAGVSALLSEDDEIELVIAVADADALIRAVAEHRPDAVLTDIRMPPTHTIEGIDAAKRIRAEYPDIGVVVLSQFADDDYAFELLENGVGGLGYLLKERVADRDELIRALQEVSRGGSALDPRSSKCCSPASRTRNRLRCSDCPPVSVRCSSRWRPGATTTPSPKPST